MGPRSEPRRAWGSRRGVRVRAAELGAGTCRDAATPAPDGHRSGTRSGTRGTVPAPPRRGSARRARPRPRHRARRAPPSTVPAPPRSSRTAPGPASSHLLSLVGRRDDSRRSVRRSRHPHETRKSRFFVALAIWYADMARKADLLRTLSHGLDSLAQFSKELQGDRPPDLLTVEITEPVQLDILWAQFFATGDPRYVERIISVLPYAAPGEHSGRLVIGLAARWSLTSNATQQARVMEICSKAARSANPQLQPLLQEVLNAARNTPRRAGRSEAQPEAR